MKLRKIITLLLALVMLTSLSCVTSFAEGEEEPKPVVSSNLNGNDYINWSRWPEKVRSYMYDTGDGGFTRVEYTEKNGAFVEVWKDDAMVKQFDIAMELPMWGGFFAGARYNFFVFGQQNYSESDTKEVIRIVRYSKDWKRIDSISVMGANTTSPFEAGSLRMAESGDNLYIHTCHLMYGHGGTRHQATMWFDVSAPQNGGMKMLNSGWEVSNNTHDYVSHSFNQFIVTDGSRVVKLDHGDAFPRSITLCRKPLDSTTTDRVTRVTVMPISGPSGDNDTGVSLGGFEATDKSYLAAGNSVSMGADYDAFGVRNIFVSSVNKDTLAVTTRFFTNYKAGENVVSNPHLVKISGGKFMLMWNEGTDAGYNALKYMFLDADGEVASVLYSVEAQLSDCKPIVMNNAVKWYVTDGKTLMLYSISLDTMQVTVTKLAEDDSQSGIIDDFDTMTVEEGTEVTLSATAFVENPSYQWKFSNDDGNTWQSFPKYESVGGETRYTGSDTGVLIFTATNNWNDNLFKCEVTIPDIPRPVYSNIVHLIVISNDPTPPDDPITHDNPIIDEPMPGDIDGNGLVDNADLVTLARFIVGIAQLNDTQLAAANLNGDTAVDNQDLVMLARKIVGL